MQAIDCGVTGEGRQGKAKRRKPAKPREAKQEPGVATSAFAPVDVSKIQRKCDILKGAKLEVLSFGKGEKNRESISKLIKELGGQVAFSSCLDFPRECSLVCMHQSGCLN